GRPVSESYGDIQIIADAEPEGVTGHGYLEYTFTVSNRSTLPHKVRLTLPAEVRRPSGGYFQAISRSVEVAPKSTVPVSLYQPFPPPLDGSDVAVCIDDALQKRALQFALRPPEDFDDLARRRDTPEFIEAFGKGNKALLVLVLSPGRQQLKFGDLFLPQ